jgi:hypothetical protein
MCCLWIHVAIMCSVSLNFLILVLYAHLMMKVCWSLTKKLIYIVDFSSYEANLITCLFTKTTIALLILVWAKSHWFILKLRDKIDSHFLHENTHMTTETLIICLWMHFPDICYFSILLRHTWLYWLGQCE